MGMKKILGLNIFLCLLFLFSAMADTINIGIQLSNSTLKLNYDSQSIEYSVPPDNSTISTNFSVQLNNYECNIVENISILLNSRINYTDFTQIVSEIGSKNNADLEAYIQETMLPSVQLGEELKAKNTALEMQIATVSSNLNFCQGSLILINQSCESNRKSLEQENQAYLIIFLIIVLVVAAFILYIIYERSRNHKNRGW